MWAAVLHTWLHTCGGLEAMEKEMVDRITSSSLLAGLLHQGGGEGRAGGGGTPGEARGGGQRPRAWGGRWGGGGLSASPHCSSWPS